MQGNRYISFSGGVESTTMCVLYGKGAKAIWVDTGAEHEEMYNRIDYVENKIKELHGGDFELIRLKGKGKYKGVDYENLEEMIVAQKFMPSQQRRYCTYYFKIKPIDDFLIDAGECDLIMGTGKSLRQLSVECESELFIDPSLYDSYKKEVKACGAFCRR